MVGIWSPRNLPQPRATDKGWRLTLDAPFRRGPWLPLIFVPILAGLSASCTARQAPALSWQRLNAGLIAHAPILALATTFG